MVTAEPPSCPIAHAKCQSLSPSITNGYSGSCRWATMNRAGFAGDMLLWSALRPAVCAPECRAPGALATPGCLVSRASSDVCRCDCALATAPLVRAYRHIGRKCRHDGTDQPHRPAHHRSRLLRAVMVSHAWICPAGTGKVENISPASYIEQEVQLPYSFSRIAVSLARDTRAVRVCTPCQTANVPSQASAWSIVLGEAGSLPRVFAATNDFKNGEERLDLLFCAELMLKA